MDENSIKLADLFGAINRKDRGWWDKLSNEQRKKFSSWLYSRYMSIVRHNNPDMHRYYVLAANNVLNRDLSKLTKHHAKLIYLLMTTIPNEFARADHQYIPPLKKNRSDKKTNNKMRVLGELYPSYKDSDVEALAGLLSDADFEQLMIGYGWDNKKIRSELKQS